jgi:co-chaperonin GroES (HSP10)
MSLQALRDEIIVRPVYEKQKGLVIIPKSAIKFKQYDGQVFGEVLSVGKRHKLGVKIGDIISWVRHEGKKIIHQGQVYFAIRERWILGRVNAGS